MQALAEGSTLQTLLNIANKGLAEKHERLLICAVRSIANFLSSESKLVEKLIELGVLDFFHTILSSNIASKMQTEVLWGLSNIAC